MCKVLEKLQNAPWKCIKGVWICLWKRCKNPVTYMSTYTFQQLYFIYFIGLSHCTFNTTALAYLILVVLVGGNVYVSLLSDVPHAAGQSVCLPTGCRSDQRAHDLLWAPEERQASGCSRAAPRAACDVWLTYRVWCLTASHDWHGCPGVWII